jgi:erythromycin esterase
VSKLLTAKGVVAMKNEQSMYEHWETWLRAHAHPIKQLEPSHDDDYRDLTFLKDVLKGKRIVMLGESSHGASEFISSRVRLVQYLYEELGYEVIAFESGLGETHVADLQSSERLPEDTMKSAVISVWHAQEMIPLFEFVRQSKQNKDPLRLSGMDMQPTGSYHHFIRRWFEQVNPNVAEQAEKLEQQFAASFYLKDIEAYQKEKVQMRAGYEALIQFVEANRSALACIYPEDPNLISVTLHVLNGRIQTVEHFLEKAVLGNKYAAENNHDQAQKYYDEITAMRDQRMVEELVWVAETLYPDKKMIVWSHNYHIRKENEAVKNARSPLPTMGGLLPNSLKQTSYVIGLYMNRGVSAFVDHQPAPVRYPHPEGSMEWILGKAGAANIFVDLAGQKCERATSWMFMERQALDWGTWEERFIPRSQYDGILFIDEVHIPDYLDEKDG